MTFKPIFKSNLAQKPKKQYFENQGGFAHMSQLSSPEAEPEAKAYVLLLIKEYNPREVGVRREG